MYELSTMIDNILSFINYLKINKKNQMKDRINDENDKFSH